MKGYPAANQMLDKWGKKFEVIFNVSLGSFIGTLVIFGIQDFDIIKFDKYLQRIGYQIKRDGSQKDYILKKYGQEAVNLINELIGKRQ